MAVTVSSFKIAYPAFAKADAAMVAARLADVELLTSDSWGTRRDLAVMLQLADVLTSDPMGRDAQTTDSQGETTYRKQYLRLAKALACGNSIRLGTVDLTPAACDD